ncbi:MAG: hypothetical protein K2M97_02235 [Muribaculaceae bacterium]|nr:hypothetical protein [Muribaculaceae bacterium]
MKSRSKVIAMSLVALALVSSCRRNRTFSVEAKVEGVETQNLTVVWRSAPSGELCVQDVTAVGNSFSFRGSTDEPTLVEIYAGGTGARLLQFMAEGGDKLRLSGRPTDLRVSGGKVAERFAEALNRIYEEPDVNLAVTDYVRRNPSDVVSAALLVSMFEAKDHEVEADTLMALLEVKPDWLVADWHANVTAPLVRADSLPSLSGFGFKGDTTLTVSGAHTYVFTQNEAHRYARLIDSMRVWSDVVDVYCGANRASWRTLVAPDSATWTRLFVPGGPGAAELVPLNIDAMPLVVVTDSAGAIIRRYHP